MTGKNIYEMLKNRIFGEKKAGRKTEIETGWVKEERKKKKINKEREGRKQIK